MEQAVIEAPVTQPTAETAPTPESKASEDRVSSKLQMLIRREKQARVLEQSAKSKEELITAKEAALTAREAKLIEFENLKETNPKKALELLGLSYQDLTQVELADGQIPAEVKIRKLEEKIAKYGETLEERDRLSAQDAKRQKEQLELQAVADYKSEISDHIKANPDRYEFLSFELGDKVAEEVYEIVDQHYNKTLQESMDNGDEKPVGKIMGVEEASNLLELTLDKKYDKLINLKKFQTKLKPVPPKVEVRQEPIRHKPQTLTNNMQGRSMPTAHVLTDEERVQKAIAYAKGLRP
jgi:hypothetical protein